MSDNQMKNGFMNLDYDQIERAEKIKRLLDETRNSPSRAALPISFMNRACDLEMIFVPIELLMYRLENGRTLSLQDEHLAMNRELPEDFFTRDDNSPEAQFAQHELLMKLSEIKDILATFKDTTNKQTEPLIITNTGFVVNGNRRLSCWRHLYFDDKETYKHFEYIRVAVLPEADEKAINKLEADLQIAPDIKADYIWHTEARMLQKRIEEQGENIDDVATLFRMKKKDIEYRFDMLRYAREYLQRNNWDRQWSKVDKEYHAFEQLVKERQRLTDSVEKSLLESLTFASVTAGASGTGEGRIYAKVPEIRKHLIPIVEGIREDLPEVIKSVNPVDDIELLTDGIDNSDENMIVVAQALIDLNEDEQKKVIIVTDNVIADENAKEREKKSTNFLMDQIKRANLYLNNAVDVCNEDNIATEGLGELLEAIEEKVDIIKAWLTDYDSKN